MENLNVFYKKNKEKILLSITLCISVIISIIHIIKRPIWRDEAFSIYVAQLPIIELISKSAADTQPPLHLIILHIWGKLFSFSDFSTRFLSVIFTLLMLCVCYRLIKMFEKRLKNRMMILALIVLSPITIFFSTEARQYSLLSLLVVSNLWFALNLFNKPTKLNFIGFLTTSILGLYTQNIFLIYLGCIYAVYLYKVFILKKTLSINLKILTTIALANVFLYLPWLNYFTKQLKEFNTEGFWYVFQPMLHFFEIPSQLFYGIYEYSNLINIDINLIVLFFAGIAIALFFYIKEKPLQSTKLFISITLLILFCSFIVSFFTPIFYGRYLSYLSPIMLIALGLVVIKLKMKYYILGLLSATLLLFGIINPTKFYPPENFKLVAEFINNDIHSTSLVLTYNGLPFHSLRHYNKNNYNLKIYKESSDVKFFEGKAAISNSDYFLDDISKYNSFYFVYLCEDKSKLPDLPLHKKELEAIFRNSCITKYSY